MTTSTPTYEELLRRPGGRFRSALEAMEPGDVLPARDCSTGNTDSTRVAVSRTARKIGRGGQYGCRLVGGDLFIVRYRPEDAR